MDVIPCDPKTVNAIAEADRLLAAYLDSDPWADPGVCQALELLRGLLVPEHMQHVPAWREGESEE